MLGFACICNSLGSSGRFRAVTVKNLQKLSEEEQYKKLKAAAVDNLYNSLQILKWCKENDIYMYRFSSDLIPLATYKDTWNWWEDRDIQNMCNKIRDFSAESHIRISMHPDQFCVLNSHRPEVVQSSLKHLEYLNRLSNMIGNKLLIIHTGSTAGGKEQAIQRFIDNFKLLPKDIQDKLAIENDDKSFGVTDVLYICEALKIPMVIDLHHHNCLNCSEDLLVLRQRIIDTWRGRKPKLHLSSGKAYFDDRHHADYINYEDYLKALAFAGDDFDIMLECKQKELALLKIREQAQSN